MRQIFDDYNLTDDQKKKGRRILRRLVTREYFGGMPNLLIRIVAENMESANILEEADTMFEWCRENKKKSSVLRFNNWVKNSHKFKKQRRERDEGLKDDVKRDFEKVRAFISKRKK